MAPTGRGLPIPTTSALLRFPQPSAPVRKPPYRISFLLPVEMIVLARYVAPRQSFSVAKIHQVQTSRVVYETGLGRCEHDLHPSDIASCWRTRFKKGRQNA